MNAGVYLGKARMPFPDPLSATATTARSCIPRHCTAPEWTPEQLLASVAQYLRYRHYNHFSAATYQKT